MMGKDWKKYCGQKSEGTIDWRSRVVGTAIDLLSPAEQGLGVETEITRDGETMLVPSWWRLILIDENGHEVSWRVPGYITIVDGAKVNNLGLNVFPKGTGPEDIIGTGVLIECYRTDSNRAKIAFCDEEDED